MEIAYEQPQDELVVTDEGEEETKKEVKEEDEGKKVEEEEETKETCADSAPPSRPEHPLLAARRKASSAKLNGPSGWRDVWDRIVQFRAHNKVISLLAKMRRAIGMNVSSYTLTTGTSRHDGLWLDGQIDET